MSDTIMVALLGVLGSFIGSFSGMNIVKYRLTQLEERVEKHNKVIERTYKLEQDESILEEKIKVINHRLDDLEHGRQ